MDLDNKKKNNSSVRYIQGGHSLAENVWEEIFDENVRKIPGKNCQSQGKLKLFC